MTKARSTCLNDHRKYDRLRFLVESAGPRIFTVRFFKVDKTLRTMKVQNAALKFIVKGDEASESAKRGVATRAANNPHLLNVYDIEKKAARSINMDTIVSIKLDGVVYSVEHNYK